MKFLYVLSHCDCVNSGVKKKKTLARKGSKEKKSCETQLQMDCPDLVSNRIKE